MVFVEQDFEYPCTEFMAYQILCDAAQAIYTVVAAAHAVQCVAAG